MKRKIAVLAKNKIFILALVGTLLGAALLGMVFACAVQRDAAAATTVEREQTVEITMDSKVLPTPEPTKAPKVNLLMLTPSPTAVQEAVSQNTFVPQGKVEDADTALLIAKHAVEALSEIGFPEEHTVEYIPENTDTLFPKPAYWSVKEAGEWAGIYVAIEADTGRIMEIALTDAVRASLDDWGNAAAADGEAALADPSKYLAAAEAHVRALFPNESGIASRLRNVRLQDGYLSVNMYVNTDTDTKGVHFLSYILADDKLIPLNYTYMEEKWWDSAKPVFDNFDEEDADAWMWELQSYDAIELVNPRKFEKADPKDAEIGKEEIERRCKDFYATATGTEFLGVISAQYYQDLSGERENYYAIAMKDGGNTLKLALSAKTGDLLDWESELSVQPMLMNGEDTRPLWDWKYDDAEEFTYVYAWFEQTVKTLCGETTLESTMVNAVYDDYYMTLNATMSTGRIHEFGFAIKNGKATLQWVNTMFSDDAFRNGYMVPWEADARVIDPNSGNIKLGWFGPEKLGGELLP